MDDSKINLQARLDQTKSIKNINADIDKLQGKIDKIEVKAEIDPKAISKSKSLLQYLSDGAKKLASLQRDILTFTEIIGNTHQAVSAVRELDTALSDLNRTAKASNFQQIQQPDAPDGKPISLDTAIDPAIVQTLPDREDINPILDAINSIGNGLDWLAGKIRTFSSINILASALVKSFA